MYETVSFPGLGFAVELNPIAFSIGSIDVYWYGIIIALGFLAALLYCGKRIKEFGLHPDRIIDVIIGGVLGGLVGGRAYYVIMSWDKYKDDWTSIFKTWEGGMAIYGAIIGGLLVAALICKWRKQPVWVTFDFASCGFLIGQCFGRWGNFINVEAFGGNTDLPWGMASTSISRYLSAHAAELEKLGMSVDVSAPVHPCFLYESLWCLVGFVLLALYTSRRRFDGELFLMYVAWYGIGRSFFEGLRTDSLLIGSLRVSQVLAVISAVAAIAIIIVVRSRINRRNDPDYLPLYVDTEECKNFEARIKEEAELKKSRKATRKEDLARAEALYERKKQEKAEANRLRKEAERAAREAEYEADEAEEEEELETEQEDLVEETVEESANETTEEEKTEE